MCGLTGYITKQGIELTPEQTLLRTRLFSALLVAMQARGTDSTGVTFINGKEQTDVKGITHAYSFIQDAQYKNIEASHYSIAIGHTRYATMGDITIDNAHPYRFGTITGAHNGHITNWKEIKPDCTVDSQAIFHLLNENKNDYIKTFERLKGGMAVTWYDTQTPHTVYLVRHDNPLFVIRVKPIDTIFWVSEVDSMLSILTALGISHTDIDEWELKENKVYTINPKLEITKKAVQFPLSYVYEAGNMLVGKNYKDDSTYDEVESMIWQVENGGCELCAKPIDPALGFYWTVAGYTVLCTSCGVKSNNPEYEYVTANRYVEILHRDMLEGMYD